MAFRTNDLIVDSQSALVDGYRLLDNTRTNNGDSVPLVPGMPVTIVGDDLVMRAWAASTAFARVDGVIVIGNGLTLPVVMRKAGRLNLTTAEWDARTGDVGGLVPPLTYYLGLTPGSLSLIPPSADGQSVAVIGKALTPTSLIIQLADPLLL
jgi:hypothetical protein